MGKGYDHVICCEHATTAEALVADLGIKAYCKEQGVEPDGYVYGCGALTPGHGLAAFSAAVSTGKLRGIIGITITEKSVVAYRDTIRAAVGSILRLAPQAYVTDALSSEWSLHYAFESKVGGHPGWLALPAELQELYPVSDEKAVPAISVGGALVLASCGCPLVMLCKPSGTPLASAAGYVPGKMSVYHPLRRFAVQYGLEDRVVETEEDARRLFEQGIGPVDPEIVKRAQADARRTLAALGFGMKQRSPFKELDDMLSSGGTVGAHPAGASPADESAPNAPRECKIGSVFDPATHYTGHYYDGRGLIYTLPDGSKQLYRGTALAWEGNATVARILAGVIASGGRLLDVGCSAGDFVKRAIENGWDAYGADISQEAINRATPDVKPRLHVEDVTQGLKSETFDVVTALDFWEHIWLKDVDRLIAAVRERLPLGGFHFACICTRGCTEEDITLEPGYRFDRAYSWLAVSGHVLIRSFFWWAAKFREHGLELRPDLTLEFQVARAEDPTFKRAESWSARNVLILERR